MACSGTPVLCNHSFLDSAAKTDSAPQVDATAEIRLSSLGHWTAVGARTIIVESRLGDYSYIGSDSSATYCSIGKFCSIASHTCLNPGNHPLWKAALHHFTYRSRYYRLAETDDAEFFEWRRQHEVMLGHDVWIGHGAMVMPGVRIGEGAAVGAGAVVTKDVPPFAVVAGVPARVIRMRFADATAEGLLRIAWWDWTPLQLSEALEDFRKLSAEQFVNKYDPRNRC